MLATLSFVRYECPADSLPSLDSPVSVPIDGPKRIKADAPVVALHLSCDALIKARKDNPSLTGPSATAKKYSNCGQKDQFSLGDGLLMRRWVAHPELKGSGIGEKWSTVNQIVDPSECRQLILKLAHEHSWSGHLGVTKTNERVLQLFFWLFVLFAIRDVKHESLGFSPTERMFGHHVCGPLKVLQEQLRSISIGDFVAQCKEKMQHVSLLAKGSLSFFLSQPTCASLYNVKPQPAIDAVGSSLGARNQPGDPPQEKGWKRPWQMPCPVGQHNHTQVNKILCFLGGGVVYD